MNPYKPCNTEHSGLCVFIKLYNSLHKYVVQHVKLIMLMLESLQYDIGEGLDLPWSPLLSQAHLLRTGG